MRSDLIILAAFTSLIAVLTATGIVLIDRAVSRQQAYEDCVASVPGYLDADEIRYQEQECEMGWHP